MSTREIGATAGKVWKALHSQGEMSVSALKKAVGRKDAVVDWAIGWLAREDKINYATKRNEVLVSLVNAEMDAFRRLYKKQPEQKASTAAKQK